MTGRLVCFAAGIGLGVAATRRLARSTSASAVEATTAAVVTRVRRAVDGVVADGRVEMRRREARLRAVLAAPRRDGAGAAGGRR
ncbi:MAG: hypothetical protein WEC34_01790 [Acidimicrobiia bacterium]|jgi:hypothetical protein